MTVTNTENKFRTEGNGITVTFPANVKIFDEGDIKVTTILRADDTLVNTLILNDAGALGYTVTFDTDAETLTVFPVTAPLVTEDLQGLRDMAQTQESDFPRVTKFPAELNENALDKNTMIIQDQQEVLNRTLKLPEETTVTDLELPEPNAGKALLWNATADSIENSTDDFNDIVTDATAQADIATAQAGIATTQAGIATDNAALTAADVISTGEDVTTTGLNVTYSSDWAILPEDTPVSVAAGGDGVTTFSSLHWASKASGVVIGALQASNNLSDVASAATSRTNLDVGGLAEANEWSGTQNFNTTTLTDATTIAWVADANQVTKVVLEGNRTLGAPSNPVEGGVYILHVYQDATGTRTLAYNAIYDWGAAGAPDLTTDANAFDILTFVYENSKMNSVINKGFGL